MTSIDDLPLEVVEEILLHSDPIDVAAVAQTSPLFRSLVYHSADHHLWRVLYLSHFDDPRACISQIGYPTMDVEWKGNLQRIVRARTVLESGSVCRPAERYAILKTILDMVCNVPPLPPTSDGISKNLLWVAALLRGGALLDQADANASEEEVQLSARLHTYFGLTHMDAKRSTRVKSRAFVYSMRNYRWDNEFGPFLMDGSGKVNWVHMQALHHVVSAHIVDLQEDEDFEFAIFPMSLPYIQAIIPPGIDLDQSGDWAGITGLWRCSFCFCDHRELLHYNDPSTPESEPLDTTIFEDPTFREVFRSLNVELRVTQTTVDPDHPNRPKISFVGEMGEPSTSTMNGWVQMTPDNQVHWHFVSGEQGNAIWSSEGVQVGAIRSTFGVLGSWTTIFHDANDPVGPFWLRKVVR